MKNVIVNFIVLEENYSKLSLLSQIVDYTNGQLILANEIDMEYKLNSILEKRIIATNVTIKLTANHKYIYLRDDEFDNTEALVFSNKKVLLNEKHKKSIILKHIGCLLENIELTYEFGLKKKEANYKKEISEIPFQLQISYETEEGVKIVRVLTKFLKFSTNREISELNVLSKELLFLNAYHKLSKHVINSNIIHAKRKAKILEKFFNRIKIYVPQCYQETMNIIFNLNDNKKFSEIDNIDKEIILSCTNVSRSIFETNAF